MPLVHRVFHQVRLLRLVVRVLNLQAVLHLLHQAVRVCHLQVAQVLHRVVLVVRVLAVLRRHQVANHLVLAAVRVLNLLVVLPVLVVVHKKVQVPVVLPVHL